MVHTCTHLSAQVGIESYDGRVEDKKDRFQLEGLPVLHQTRTNQHNDEVDHDQAEGRQR